mgnify:CR=1 FL=1
MKTREFIADVEAQGYTTTQSFFLIKIYREGRTVAQVGTDIMCQIKTDYYAFDQLTDQEKTELFNSLTKYAGTPIGEREEEKKLMRSKKNITQI